MEVVVMLAFDDATDAALRAVWQRLADAGLPHAVDPRHRPHLSVAVTEVDGPDVLVAELSAVASAAWPVDVAWSGLGVFAPARDGGTVFAAPVVTAELLALHAGVHARLSAAGFDLADDDHPFLVPGRWAPHSTLHTDLDADGIATAVAAALAAFPLAPGRVEHLVVAPKARDAELWSARLGAGPG